MERVRSRGWRRWARGGFIAIAAAAASLCVGPAMAQAAGAGEMAAPPTERRLLLPSGAAQTDSGAADQGIVETLIPLAIVLGLIFGCAAAFRKLSGARGPLAAALGRAGRAPSGLVEVLARYPLGRGQTLVLLRLDRRVLLLSQSAAGRFGCATTFTPLCDITDPEDVASILAKAQDEEGESMAARFRAMLGRFDQSGDELEAEPWLPPRRTVLGEADDRAELLAESDPGEAAPPTGSLRLTPEDRPAAHIEGPTPLDAVGSLRRRLETLRLAEGS